MNLPIVPERPWAARGACRAPEVDPDWFYPHESDTYTIQLALRICRGCPVKDDCARHSFEAREKQGIWGALTPDQRAGLKRSKRRVELKASREGAA